MAPADLHFQVDIAHWGWTIVWFLWFVGIAGMGSVAYFFVRKAALAYVIFGSLVLGLAFVVSHLGRWWNLPRTIWTMVTNGIFNWSSWMLVGIVLLSVHLVLSLVIVAGHIPWLQRIGWLKWTAKLGGANAFLAVYAALGFMATVYSGFLLTQAAGIPLWNTSLIPILWVVSGSIAAIAVIELLYVFGQVESSVSTLAVRLGLGLDAIKLLAVLGFLHVALSYGSAGARIGATAMASGEYALMTWGGVIGVGILIPIAIGLYTVLVKKSKPLLVISSVAALAGVFFLRAVVLLAGAWEPLVL
jgi:formate-dependent nitrite reductase membrane component NrfD